MCIIALPVFDERIFVIVYSFLLGQIWGRNSAPFPCQNNIYFFPVSRKNSPWNWKKNRKKTKQNKYRVINLNALCVKLILYRLNASHYALRRIQASVMYQFSRMQTCLTWWFYFPLFGQLWYNSPPDGPCHHSPKSEKKTLVYQLAIQGSRARIRVPAFWIFQRCFSVSPTLTVFRMRLLTEVPCIGAIHWAR